MERARILSGCMGRDLERIVMESTKWRTDSRWTYTWVMMRRNLIVLALLAIAATAAGRRPQIRIPTGRYAVHEQIHAKIENDTKDSVTYCVEYGQTSMNDGEVEATPSPFLVQRKDGSQWNTLLIGPDVGSSRHAVVLDAGESHEFPFRLNDAGTMRLALWYWRGSMPDLDCGAPPKHAEKVLSRPFAVE